MTTPNMQHIAYCDSLHIPETGRIQSFRHVREVGFGGEYFYIAIICFDIWDFVWYKLIVLSNMLHIFEAQLFFV